MTSDGEHYGRFKADTRETWLVERIRCAGPISFTCHAPDTHPPSRWTTWISGAFRPDSAAPNTSLDDTQTTGVQSGYGAATAFVEASYGTEGYRFESCLV